MNPDAKKKLIGALVAAALAIAVYYGLINQQQATNIQNQTNQTLGTTPASQQPAPQPAPRTQPPQTTQVPAPTSPAPQSAPQPPQPPKQ